MKDNKGLSLIELIVVIAIMAVMGGFIFISFGLLTGQDARECASNLSTALDKEKNYALTRSGETDCYVKITHTADGYFAEYRVPTKAVEEHSPMVTIEEENIGHPTVNVTCYYDDGGGSPAFVGSLNDGDVLQITYNRVTGAIEEIKLNDDAKTINLIKIDKGREYEIVLYTATGKHTLERTD